MQKAEKRVGQELLPEERRDAEEDNIRHNITTVQRRGKTRQKRCLCLLTCFSSERSISKLLGVWIQTGF